MTDMNGKTRMLRCAPFLCRLRRRECCMLGAPSSQPTVPLRKLPPARLVIHRQTSAHERRKWTRSVQSRSGILAYLCTRQHWLWITVELHISVTAAQEYRCRVPGSISSGLTPTLREDWSCKRVLETPCHAWFTTSPQGPTAMSLDHWSNLTWDTISAGGHDLLVQ